MFRKFKPRFYMGLMIAIMLTFIPEYFPEFKWLNQSLLGYLIFLFAMYLSISGNDKTKQ